MVDLIFMVFVLAILARKFDRLAVLDVGRGLLRLEFHDIPPKDDGSDSSDKRKELK
jgi:hypothetical protein